MLDKIKIIASLRARLTDDRFLHSLNVADMAKELAQIHGEHTDTAYLAGLVHDCTKNTPPQVQEDIIREGGIRLSALEQSSKKLWHAISGSVFIQTEYGIDNPAIISAVRYHTTGKADMSLLERIIYTADFVSIERNYPGVERIRDLAKNDLDAAVYEGAAFTVKKLTDAGLPVHPDTLACEAYYKAKEKS